MCLIITCEFHLNLVYPTNKNVLRSNCKFLRRSNCNHSSRWPRWMCVCACVCVCLSSRLRNPLEARAYDRFDEEEKKKREKGKTAIENKNLRMWLFKTCVSMQHGDRASCLATGNHERKSYRVASGPRLLRNTPSIDSQARAVLFYLSLSFSPLPPDWLGC